MNSPQSIEYSSLQMPRPTLVEPELVPLSPVQQRAYDRLVSLASATPIVALTGAPGSGRSIILRTLSARFGGRVVTMQDILVWSQLRDPESTDEAIQRGIETLLAEYDFVLIDGFQATFHPHGRGTRDAPAFKDLVTKHLYATATRMGKRLLLCERPVDQHGETAEKLFNSAQVASVEIEDFEIEDYAAICTNILGENQVRAIDFKTVYRYVAGLTGHQLRMACGLLAGLDFPTAEDFITVLQGYIVTGNIRVEQVEALSFDSLPGSEHITSRLESQIVLPMQNRELAQRLGLKPKRGVLLYGPPGTGKTSIGRALAHRMKGKFFMIDGTFVTEPPIAFFAKLRNVIREAKENAPSVLFIDDADVLFTIDHIAGLSRYMLTLLDGLESESSSHVCVMMTAMDVRKVPEALLRSGRVELWLETRPPSEETRGQVLQRWLGTEMPASEAIDYSALASATEGFTPADLRRVAGDAKSLYAADIVHGRKLATANDYLHLAVDQLVAIRTRMADILGDESLRIGGSGQKPKYGLGLGGMAEMGVSCKTRGW
jgi:AAA+ superfamily predicted ATPase